jgi:hypothetical protein
MSTNLADRMFDKLNAARRDAALAHHDLAKAQDAAHHARVALEGLSAELDRLGLGHLADAVSRAESRLAEVDPYAVSDLQIADVIAVWG